MTDHTAVVLWDRQGAVFTDRRYSRGHRWQFDGGIEIAASSSPHVVPVPLSTVEAVDPEEAFVASLSSCHMLWFLSIAAGHRIVVDSYRDQATGSMGRDASGSLWMAQVTLRPRVHFIGRHRPEAERVLAMHHEAHEQCFLARSVRTGIRIEPVVESEAP
jgi:organic hydroperoxide reductase OsmC/OhrA